MDPGVSCATPVRSRRARCVAAQHEQRSSALLLLTCPFVPACVALPVARAQCDASDGTEGERELFRPREGRRAKLAFKGGATPQGLGVIVEKNRDGVDGQIHAPH